MLAITTIAARRSSHEECIHLNDDIKALIRQGKLKRFFCEDNPQHNTQQTSIVEEEVHAAGGQEQKKILLCILTPEDFYVPDSVEEKSTAPTLFQVGKVHRNNGDIR
jgi:hypothetical protein